MIDNKRMILIASLLFWTISISAQDALQEELQPYQPPTSITILGSKPDSIPGTMPGSPPTSTLPDTTRRDFDQAGCFASGCHAKMREQRWLHGPVAVGACESCHVLDGPAELHKYKQVRDQKERCTICHLPKEDLPVKHDPFLKFECVKCHTPHGGSSKAFLSEAKVAVLCASCHDGKEHDGKKVSLGPQVVSFPHEPTVKGDCVSCHSSHQTRHEKLLVRDKKMDLCLGCHHKLTPLAKAADGQAENYLVPRPLPVDTLALNGDLLVPGQVPYLPPPDSLYYYVTGPVPGMELIEPAPADTIGEKIVELMFVHKPLTSDCSACHLAHGSNVKGALRDEPRPLCLSCHKEFEQKIQTANSHHGPAFNNEPCSRCHLDHASRYPHLMRQSSRDLCLGCHDKQIESVAHTTIANIKTQLTDAASIHEPLNTGCVSCHLNHASHDRTLLRGPYPTDNYTDFNMESYQLCLACHKSEPFTQAVSEVTGFRNGDRNLHYLHVRGDKQRTCGNCHTPHGSPQARLIAENTLFGPKDVRLPQRYEKTATGGSCSSGCHRRLRYDREVPAIQTKMIEPESPHN